METTTKQVGVADLTLGVSGLDSARVGRSPRIYVASSWRNAHQPRVVELLRGWGLDVYDFRCPPNRDLGFAWSDIDPNWLHWSAPMWRRALDHPLALAGFRSDFEGMEWADACVLVLPSGRSSHLEAGWFVGRGRPVCVYAPEPVEPDLMVKLCDALVVSPEELRAWFVKSGLMVHVEAPAALLGPGGSFRRELRRDGRWHDVDSPEGLAEAEATTNAILGPSPPRPRQGPKGGA